MDDSLDPQATRLLEFLVAQLPGIEANDPRTFVGYKQVHEALGLPQLGNTYGVSLQSQGLNSLANWTAKSGKPGITGLIIDKGELSPGPGYFKLFGRKPEDVNWWLNEIGRSKTFDWMPYVKSSVPPQPNLPWTIEELRASVTAYMEMLRLERTGAKFTKTRYYNDLAAKFGRTPGAYEYRMLNISYVLALMGRRWLKGLTPAKNVGARVGAQIEELIAELDGAAISPTVEFELAVREAVERKLSTPPQGTSQPNTTTTTVTQYQRDPSVKAWVLVYASGICECCKKPAPFAGSDGLPYLEVHHIRRLAERGSDTISNTVAICPNCHKELHYGRRSAELVDSLYESVPRLIRE